MKKGFTLVELLIVVAIIAILAVVAFVALDPLTRFQDSRDSQRSSDVVAMLDALKLHQVDNEGTYSSEWNDTNLPANGNNYMIGTCSSALTTDCGAVTIQTGDCVDLTVLATDGYLASVPTDPSTGSASSTDYYISKASNNAITIGSCDPEGGDAISAAR